MAGSKDLAILLRDFDDEAAFDLVRRRLAAGDDPLALVDECTRGMRMIGERYESGTYYISALIMAGELLREILQILTPLISPERQELAPTSTMVLCTVKGDIHDLGKNLAADLLRAHGLKIVDLGIDVAPERIADVVEAQRPDIVGLSCLVAVFASLRESVEAVRTRAARLGLHVPIIIGGGPVTQGVCDYAGADRWCTDAVVGVRLVHELLPPKA